jgi:hypothetical protein
MVYRGVTVVRPVPQNPINDILAFTKSRFTWPHSSKQLLEKISVRISHKEIKDIPADTMVKISKTACVAAASACLLTGCICYLYSTLPYYHPTCKAQLQAFIPQPSSAPPPPKVLAHILAFVYDCSQNFLRILLLVRDPPDTWIKHTDLHPALPISPPDSLPFEPSRHFRSCNPIWAQDANSYWKKIPRDAGQSSVRI